MNKEQIYDNDGFSFISARLLGNQLGFQDSDEFIQIVESCIECGQITEDDFYQEPDERDYYLSEEGMILAIMDCPNTDIIKRKIAEVFTAWKHGKLTPGQGIVNELRVIADLIDNYDVRFAEVRKHWSNLFAE